MTDATHEVTGPPSPATPELKGWVQRALDKVEVVGNKLPQPVTLFAILMGLVLVASWW